MPRSTRLITVEVTLRDSVTAFEEAIKATLPIEGHLLNWIVTDVNVQQQTLIVDALVVDCRECE